MASPLTFVKKKSSVLSKAGFGKLATLAFGKSLEFLLGSEGGDEKFCNLGD